MFEDYLNEIAHKYTPEKYHVIDHNCNNFTDEACEFLVGKGIPKKVVDQAKDLLNTPMGQQFKPFLMQMQGTIQNPPPGMFKWAKKKIILIPYDSTIFIVTMYLSIFF